MSVSPLRRTMIIRRRVISIVFFLSIFLSLPGFAQQQGRQEDEPPPEPRYAPKKDEVQGPRAVAVLETTSRGMRLVPIAIKVEGKFYDASIYKAQPVPMALDSGVIYEVFKSGEPVGDFTIYDAEQSAAGGWHGIGSFVSKADEDRRAQQRAKEAVAEAAKKAAEEQEELGSRPVLKRAQPKEGSDGQSSSGSTASSGSGGSQPSSTQSDDNSDRPSLKRPVSSDGGATDAKTTTTAPATTANSQAAPPSTASSGAPPASPPKPATNESDTPVLRRAPVAQTVAGPMSKPPATTDNKPAKQASTADSKQSKQDATAAEARRTIAPPPEPTNLQVAISDASSKQVHPYRWEWKDAEEQAKLKADAEKLALAELSKFAARTSRVKPGDLTDVSFQAFDLNYTNSAVVVLSARALPAATPAAKPGAKAQAVASTSLSSEGLELYVTIVGRVDIYGVMQKELAVATDNHHLDAYPKMRLIDVVDVDGNGGADLLFRSTSDVSNSFVIYRDKGWSLEEVISVQEPRG